MSESIEKRIESKLRAAMDVTHFEIHDTSGNCGGSFAIVLVSPGFQGKMTLARHKLGAYELFESSPAIIDMEKRMPSSLLLAQPSSAGTYVADNPVNSILQDEIASVHAFSQKTFTPAQWEKEQAKPKEHSH